MPGVSLIISCCNASKSLTAAVERVQSQTLKEMVEENFKEVVT